MKLETKLRRILRPGEHRWYLGKMCPACDGSCRTKELDSCKTCKGLGRVGVLAYVVSLCLIQVPFAMPSSLLKGSELLYTWEDWHRDQKKKHPVKYFIQFGIKGFYIHKIKLPLRRRYHIFMNKYINKEHILDIGNEANGYLKSAIYGFHTFRTRTLFASFEALNLFMEQTYEFNKQFINGKTKYEIRVLHNWWNVVRPSLLKSGAYYKHIDIYEKEDNEMLERLMRIRDRLDRPH